MGGHADVAPGRDGAWLASEPQRRFLADDARGLHWPAGRDAGLPPLRHPGGAIQAQDLWACVDALTRRSPRGGPLRLRRGLCRARTVNDNKPCEQFIPVSVLKTLAFSASAGISSLDDIREEFSNNVQTGLGGTMPQ